MAELLDDPAELDRILADGADRAREVAQATMARVRDRGPAAQRPLRASAVTVLCRRAFG